jgi:hypothetical protein
MVKRVTNNHRATYRVSRMRIVDVRGNVNRGNRIDHIDHINRM